MNSDNAKKSMTDTEVMIGELDRVIAEELAKDAPERDDRLIDECIKEIAELKGVRVEYNKEEIGAIFEQLEAKASAEKKSHVRSRRLRRPIAAACAAALVLVCGVASVAWNPFTNAKNWVLDIFNMPVGSITESSKITYINFGKLTHYNSMDELIEKEHLSIYYPTALPENIYITEIESLMIEDSNYIIIHFNEPSYEYIIQLNTPLYLNNPNYEIIKNNEIEFYVSHQNNQYIARTYIESNLYLIECNSYEDIVFIINNCKKGLK